MEKSEKLFWKIRLIISVISVVCWWVKRKVEVWVAEIVLVAVRSWNLISWKFDGDFAGFAEVWRK